VGAKTCEKQSSLIFMRKQIPKVHGHRGARGRRPENTLESVQFSIDCGVDGIEVDLCVSADDVVVLHHDLALSPSIAIDQNGHRLSAPIPIRSMTYSEIEDYDVGQLDKNGIYGQKFMEQTACPGARIPSLRGFIEYVLQYGSDDLIFNLELKGNPYKPQLLPQVDAYVRAVISEIERHQITSRTFVQSFDWHLVQLVSEALPALTTGVLTDMQPDGNPRIPLPGTPSKWTNLMSLDEYGGSVPRMVAASNAKVWSSNYRDLSQNLFNEAKELDLDVYVWTVNEVVDMEAMIAMGVDVITTDYPERLIALMRR